MWMKKCDGEHDLSDIYHLMPRAIGCGIRVDMSASLGPRKKIVGSPTSRLWRLRQCLRFILTAQSLKDSCRIYSRDRSILDSLIREARQHWLSARSDKIDIYASEGSVQYPYTK
jgi:hypothetical protein